MPRPIHPVQREHALCQIDPHGSNLLHDFPSGYQIEFRHLNLGTSMPSPCRGSPFHSLGVIATVPRSLTEVLQSISDVMFPADPERCPLIDSVGYDGDSPLHVLAWRNDLEGVQVLVEAGANVNAVGEMDETPLHIAVTQQNVLMTKALLQAGARDDVRCDFGDSPRERALKRGGPTASLFKDANDT